MFTHSPQELFDLCALALDIAKQKGATAAEADLSESVGQDVQVRLQEIEHIEHQQDKSLDITVYLGQSKGRASTADFSRRAIEETVCAALDIARHTAQDDCAGLADAELMAREFGDLDKYHPWELSAEEAAALARRCEAAALGADARVKNSEGADVQTSHYQFAYGNSNGFLQHERGTRHSVSCSVVAEAGGTMQRDYWYDLARSREELDSMENIGRTAALRTVRRLGAASLPTRNCPCCSTPPYPAASSAISSAHSPAARSTAKAASSPTASARKSCPKTSACAKSRTSPAPGAAPGLTARASPPARASSSKTA